MLDKMEPPGIPDGYGISVAYACLLDIVRSISFSISGPSVVGFNINKLKEFKFMFKSLQIGEENPLPYKHRATNEEKTLHCQLINSSWCGLLAALTPLIDAATDEAVTENVLKAMQNYSALCGTLELQTPRDAFITSLCKASLPPHYALNVLNMGYQGMTLKSKKTFKNLHMRSN